MAAFKCVREREPVCSSRAASFGGTTTNESHCDVTLIAAKTPRGEAKEGCEEKEGEGIFIKPMRPQETAKGEKYLIEPVHLFQRDQIFFRRAFPFA